MSGQPPFQQSVSLDWQKYLQSLATTELQQPVGSAILMALGSIFDALSDRVRLSIKAKFPGSGFSAPDALSAIGTERGILENPGESDSSYTSRLQNAFNIWQFAGTAEGVLRALYDAGYPNVGILQQNGNYYTINVDGNNNTSLIITTAPRTTINNLSPLMNPVLWVAGTAYAQDSVIVPNPRNGFYYVTNNGGTVGTVQPTWPTVQGQGVFDNGVHFQCKGQDFWNRFIVVFFTPFPTSWAGTPPVNGSSDQIRVSALISQWKSAHSICSFIVATSGYLWDWPAPELGLTWNTWRATWDTNTTPAPTYWTP